MVKTQIDFNKLKSHYDEIMTRKYNDMEDSYKEKLKSGNPTIYKVYIKHYGDFEEGLTVINPGRVGKEYYMTKGHRHVKPMAEIYLLVSGKGKLLVQEGKRVKIMDLKKNVLYHVPATSGHRLVNIGNKPLEVMTIYGKNSGHDYRYKFNKSIMKG
jgi:glucose-6-phosphate isomerase